MTKRRSRRGDDSLGRPAMGGGYADGTNAVCQCGRAVLLGRICSAAIALACVLVAMTVAPKAQAQAVEGTVSIVPGASTVGLKEGTFTVFVVLEDLEHHGILVYDDNRDSTPDREIQSDGLAAFEFTIRFDPALLEPEAASLGPDVGRTGRQFQCLQPDQKRGSFSFGCISIGLEPAGTQGTVTLAGVTFRTLAAGTSPLELEVVLAGPLGSDQVPVAVQSGAVRVAAELPVGGSEDPPAPTPGDDPARPGASLGDRATPARDGGTAAVGDVTVDPSGRLIPEAQSDTSAAGENDGPGAGVWLAVALGVAAIVAGAGLRGAFWWRHNRQVGRWRSGQGS